MSEPIDLGHGHTLRYTRWTPDREINPQYAHLPDVDRWGAIVGHPAGPTPLVSAEQSTGYCEGAITFDGPVQRELEPAGPKWTVESGEPLTLSPSCGVHKVHHPRSHVNEVHHVWPRGDGGPDIPANRVVICATGHNSTHHLLDAYRKAGGDPGWDIRQQYHPGERALAALGWDRIQRQAL